MLAVSAKELRIERRWEDFARPSSSCPAPCYRYQYNISLDTLTFDTQAEVIFQASNICELSQINDFYTCAHQRYDELLIAQRSDLTAMMVKLHQFWYAYPPANLDREAVDKTIRSYVTLLRSGNAVLEHGKAIKKNTSEQASLNPSGITEKASCG